MYFDTRKQQKICIRAAKLIFVHAKGKALTYDEIESSWARYTKHSHENIKRHKGIINRPKLCCHHAGRSTIHSRVFSWIVILLFLLNSVLLQLLSLVLSTLTSLSSFSKSWQKKKQEPLVKKGKQHTNHVKSWKKVSITRGPTKQSIWRIGEGKLKKRVGSLSLFFSCSAHFSRQADQ